MPPIKRTQKSTGPASRRRVAGRPAAGRPADDRPATREDEIAADAGNGTDTDTGPADAGADSGADDARAPRRRPGGRALAIAGIVVGLAAGGAGAYLATEPGVGVDNQAFVDQQATDEVLAAASTNVQRLVAIDHETLDAYHDSLGEFLTPNLVSQLDENWPTLKDTYEQSKTKVDAQVREAGLAYLSGDKAEVLLVQDVSMTRDGTAAGSTTGTYLVGLDRVDGFWKLSRIPDLPS